MLCRCANPTHKTQLLRSKPVDENTSEIWIRDVDAHDKDVLVYQLVEPDELFCYISVGDTFGYVKIYSLTPKPIQEALKSVRKQLASSSIQSQLLVQPVQPLQQQQNAKLAPVIASPPVWSPGPLHASPLHASPGPSPLAGAGGGGGINNNNNNNNFAAKVNLFGGGGGLGGGNFHNVVKYSPTGRPIVPGPGALCSVSGCKNDTFTGKHGKFERCSPCYTNKPTIPNRTFSYSVPVHATDPVKHVEWLNAAARRASSVSDGNKAAGGVMPIVKDTQTNETFFLLGARNREYIDPNPVLAAQQQKSSDDLLEFGTFHGWVDKGETYEQGVARECCEESNDLIASHFGLDRCDIWRAVVMQHNLFTSVMHRKNGCPTVLMYLGEFSKADRDAFEKKFDTLHSKPGARTSDELEAVAFFECKKFRSDCMNGAMTPEGERIIRTCPKTGKNSGKLRKFLVSYFEKSSYWDTDCPPLVDAVEHANVRLLPLSSLPKLDPSTKASLPYKIN